MPTHNESNRRNVNEAFAGYPLDQIVSPKTVGTVHGLGLFRDLNDSTRSNVVVIAFGGIQAQNDSYATDLSTVATERVGQ